MTPILTLFVAGIPRPGGSKTATVIRRKGGEIVMKNGRPLIATRDDAKGNAEWKQLVTYFGRRAFEGDPARVALRVDVTFVMPRLKGHYGSGRNSGVLKPNAPRFHTVKPDATKLMRALEDALTGIVWADDALISQQQVHKVYGEKPGAWIKVHTLADVAEPPAVSPSPLFAGATHD